MLRQKRRGDAHAFALRPSEVRHEPRRRVGGGDAVRPQRKFDPHVPVEDPEDVVVLPHDHGAARIVREREALVQRALLAQERRHAPLRPAVQGGDARFALALCGERPKALQSAPKGANELLFLRGELPVRVGPAGFAHRGAVLLPEVRAVGERFKVGLHRGVQPHAHALRQSRLRVRRVVVPGDLVAPGARGGLRSEERPDEAGGVGFS